jgi:hypothetical protein
MRKVEKPGIELRKKETEELWSLEEELRREGSINLRYQCNRSVISLENPPISTLIGARIERRS